MRHPSTATPRLPARHATPAIAPRRAALAEFLRARRAQLQPAMVGLPVTGRRRTPGLRREEVARLADVGLVWYTWLEQGRDVHPSAAVLDRIATALRLDAVARRHLFVLARDEVPVPAAAPSAAVSPAVLALLAAWDASAVPVPAYVIDERWQLLAWNRSACRTFADFEAMAPDARHLLRFVLTDPAHRAALVDWAREAQGAVALFRTATAHAIGAPWHQALVASLTRDCPEFAAWWARPDLQVVHDRPKRYRHPTLGLLAFTPTMLAVAEAPGQVVIAYPPAVTGDSPP